MEKNVKKEAIGVGEKLQYLAHEVNDNTVRFEVCYPRRISAEIMEKAVLAVVQGIDVLHSSMLVEKNKAYWQTNPDVSAKDCFSVVETKEDPEILADRAMLRAAAPEDRAQMYAALVQGEEKSVMTLTISHLCVDGGDAKYLLEKVSEAYNLIAQGKDLQTLELKNGSRSAFQLYDDKSRKEIMAAMKGLELGSGQSPFPFADEEAGELHIVKCRLEPELVQKMKKYGKEKGVTLNDLLLTAFYRAYIDLPGAWTEGDISIMSMMDLRRHRKDGQSEGLANMSGTLPTVLHENIHGSFEETLMEIAAQTKKAKEDELAGLYGLPLIHVTAKLLPMSFLSKKMGEAMKSLAVGMTNLGNVAAEKLTLDGICPEDVFFGGPLKKKPGMQIAVIGFGGAINFVSVGEYTDNDAVVIRGVMEDIAAKLREIA